MRQRAPGSSARASAPLFLHRPWRIRRLNIDENHHATGRRARKTACARSEFFTAASNHRDGNVFALGAPVVAEITWSRSRAKARVSSTASPANSATIPGSSSSGSCARRV